MSNPIFRSAAMARMSSPDQLDQVVRVSSAREWLALLALVVLVVIAIVWGFEGRLATRTDGLGATVRTGNDTDLEVAVFVPAMKAQEVKPGMAVEVIPAGVRVEKYGFIRGTVRTVAESPAKENALLIAFQNAKLAQAAAGDGPVNEVRVQLNRDKGARSGYQWSTKDGAPLKIGPVMPCVARIVVREDPPVTLVIPALKRWAEAF